MTFEHFHRMAMEIKKIFVPLNALLFLIPAAADEADLLAQRLAEHDYYQASFSQSVYAVDGELIQEGAGRVAIQRPQDFRWDTDIPLQQTVIVRGDRYYQYDPDLEQLIDEPVSDRAAGLLYLLLAADVERVRQYYHVLLLDQQVKIGLEVSVARDSVSDRFRVLPRNNGSLFSSAILEFYEGRLQSIRVEDDFQQSSHFDFYDIVVNAAPDLKLFQLDVPPGTDILRR